jgi:hypothetical protein
LVRASSDRAHAAVDQQFAAGDEAAVLGRQEQHRRRDLFGPRQAAETTSGPWARSSAAETGLLSGSFSTKGGAVSPALSARCRARSDQFFRCMVSITDRDTL